MTKTEATYEEKQFQKTLEEAFRKASEQKSTNLSPRFWGISNQGTLALASALASALEKDSTLTSIDLSWNNISDQGAIAIASALAENSTLT